MRRLGNQKIVVSIVYVTAMFMVAMDATIVNVALKSISAELQIPPSATGTVNVGYLVSLAMFLPVSGWLGDRFGTKRILLIALVLFTGASAISGMANHIVSLNLSRMIQGIGGGLLTPVGMAMLFRTFTAEERPKISRLLVIPIALAPMLGPVVGGFFVEYLSWRWIFYINVPVGGLALLFGWICLKEYKASANKRFDLKGFLLSVFGFSMLMYALNQSSVKGWSAPEIVITGLCGILLIISFIYVELRISQPMLELRLFKDRLFRNMSLTSFFIAAGLLGMLYVFPLMYQDALNASALESGLVTFPEAVGLMVASQIVPWFLSKAGPRLIMITALPCAAVTFVLMSLVGQETSTWFIRLLLFFAGFFLGNTVSVVQATIFNTTIQASMGQATTLFNIQNRMGSALGVALLSSLLAVLSTNSVDVTAAQSTNLLAYRAALLSTAGFLLIAFYFVLRFKDLNTVSAKGNQSNQDDLGEDETSEMISE
ncbi:EmrB/QacA subfamily drug resistance transporter [Salibacterium salarium]|uniref:DHA2 family efflux MFS transporter permease subunit n=1 Tax=Salibacterium salarium TaxID=284579 RepID=UPI00278B9D69|nr:DHA2 family efflux MFS transporter permease subunit [Salibacterium salarium]MDQ0297943.1 EmrB/QacA subfamily drug resistance transporter [Salibacterium salarium]